MLWILSRCCPGSTHQRLRKQQHYCKRLRSSQRMAHCSKGRQVSFHSSLPAWKTLKSLPYARSTRRGEALWHRPRLWQQQMHDFPVQPTGFVGRGRESRQTRRTQLGCKRIREGMQHRMAAYEAAFARAFMTSKTSSCGNAETGRRRCFGRLRGLQGCSAGRSCHGRTRVRARLRRKGEAVRARPVPTFGNNMQQSPRRPACALLVAGVQRFTGIMYNAIFSSFTQLRPPKLTRRSAFRSFEPEFSTARRPLALRPTAPEHLERNPARCSSRRRRHAAHRSSRSNGRRCSAQ